MKREVYKVILKNTLVSLAVLIIFTVIMNHFFAETIEALKANMIKYHIAEDKIDNLSRVGIQVLSYSIKMGLILILNLWMVWVNLDLYKLLVNRMLHKKVLALGIMPLLTILGDILFLFITKDVLIYVIFVIIGIIFNLLGLFIYWFTYLYFKKTNNKEMWKFSINIENINSLLTFFKASIVFWLLFIFGPVSADFLLTFLGSAIENAEEVITAIFIILSLIFGVYFLIKFIRDFRKSTKMYRSAQAAIERLINSEPEHGVYNVFVVLKRHCFKLDYLSYYGDLHAERYQFERLIREYSTEDKKVLVHYITEDIFLSIPEHLITKNTVLFFYLNLINDKFLHRAQENTFDALLQYLKQISAAGCHVKFLCSSSNIKNRQSYDYLMEKLRKNEQFALTQEDYFENYQFNTVNFNNRIRTIIESAFLCIENSKIVDEFIIGHKQEGNRECMLRSAIFDHLARIRSENALVGMYNKVLKFGEFQMHIISLFICGTAIKENRITIDDVIQEIQGASIGKWRDFSRSIIASDSRAFVEFMNKDLGKEVLACIRQVYKSISNNDAKPGKANIAEIYNCLLAFRNRTQHGMTHYDVISSALLSILKLVLIFAEEILNSPFMLKKESESMVLCFEETSCPLENLIIYQRENLFLLNGAFGVHKEYIDYLRGNKLADSIKKIRLDERY